MQLIKLLFFVLIITGAAVGVFVIFKPDLTSYAKGLYLYNQGNLAYRKYDYETARWYYKQAADLHPEPEKVYLRLGDTEFHLGDEEEALRAYQMALEHEPHMKEAIMKIADKEWEYGHRKIALAMYKEALEHYPEDKEINLRLADLYMQTARETREPHAYDQALEIYRQYADEDPSLRYQVAEALYARRRYHEALALYCDLAAEHPYNAETLYSLALTLGKTKAYNDAYKTMKKAAELMTLRDEKLADRWINKALDFQLNRKIYEGVPDDQVFVCMQRLRLAEVELEADQAP